MYVDLTSSMEAILSREMQGFKREICASLPFLLCEEAEHPDLAISLTFIGTKRVWCGLIVVLGFVRMGGNTPPCVGAPRFHTSVLLTNGICI